MSRMRPIVHEWRGVRVEVGTAVELDDGEVLLQMSAVPVGGRLLIESAASAVPEAIDPAETTDVEVPNPRRRQ